MMSFPMFFNLAPLPPVLNISCYLMPIKGTPMLSTDWAQLTSNSYRFMMLSMQPAPVNLFCVRTWAQMSLSSQI